MTKKERKRSERHRQFLRKKFYSKYVSPEQVKQLLAIKSPHWRHKQFLIMTQGKCQFCGSTENLTIDHIIPVVITGQDRRKDLSNQQLLCRPCNLAKGSKIIGKLSTV